MNDSFTEVTRTSWGGRIGKSISGMLFGILMFFGSFGLIWWNEGRSVDRIKTLDEGRGAVVSVTAERADQLNNGDLIHVTGMAKASKPVSDRIFGIQEQALKLRRNVEMYQWVENTETRTKNNVGGSETKETTYTYTKSWSGHPHRSSDFKHPEGHTNPGTMPYQSKTIDARDIRVGAFKLAPVFVSQIKAFEDYPITEKNVRQMDPQLSRVFRPHNGQEFYKGTPNNPQIGDLRIRYQVVKPQDLSVVGKQNGDRIITYTTERGKINLLQHGALDADSMFQAAEDKNKMVTWLVRAGGFFLMWFGLMSVLAPLKMLANVLPLLGNIVGAGLGLVSFVAALVLSFVTMALAWVFYRPLIGGALLILAGGFLFGGFKVIGKKIKALNKPIEDDNVVVQRS